MDFAKSKWNDNQLSEIDFSDAAFSYKWQRGGLVWNGKYIECNAYPTPSLIKTSSLLNLIERNQYNPVYFLSPNAAEGILRRVDNQNRSLFKPLRIALETLRAKK